MGLFGKKKGFALRFCDVLETQNIFPLQGKTPAEVGNMTFKASLENWSLNISWSVLRTAGQVLPLFLFFRFGGLRMKW